MSAFSESINNLQSTLPNQFSLEDAQLAKVARGGSVVSSIKSALSEHLTTYIDGELPDSSRPAKYALDAVGIVQDTSTAATTYGNYANYVSQVNTAIASLKAQTSDGLNNSQNRLAALSDRKKKLYGLDAASVLPDVKSKALAALDAKADLVRFV